MGGLLAKLAGSPWMILGLIAAFAGASFLVYQKGRADERASIMATVIAEKDRQIQVALDTADAARKREEARSIEAAESQEKVDEYEKELAARGPAAACLLTDDDVRRLR